MKEKYIKDINKRFKGETKDLLLKQIEMFYKETNVEKTKYKTNDDVLLKKGTFLHGIFGGLENFDFTIENGFISTDFTEMPRANKITNSVGMWNIQKDILLKDYINEYSGITIIYNIGRGPNSKTVGKMIPYHQFDKITEEINNKEEIWSYWGEQTKEVRFLPSLVSNKRQIAFILNTSSPYAKKLIKADVWNEQLSEEVLKPFIDERFFDKFKEERHHRTVITTNRESSIMFGLPSSLIEGVLVGKEIEKNKKSLDYIKSKLPDCYICNLDGKVIVGNK